MPYKINPFTGNPDYYTSGGGSSTPNVQTVTSAATVTPTFTNDEVAITAQSAALLLANPTGTPVDGKNLVIRIKDNGTARAITYDTQYRAIGVTLPTTTVINKTIYLGLVYNLTDTKWDVVGVSIEGADSLYDSGWIDYSATSTIVGWSSLPTKIIKYRVIGKQMFVMVNIQGTSNSTTTTYTLPFNAINENNFIMHVGINNGTGVQARADITKNSNIITHIYWTGVSSVSNYSNTGTKGIFEQFFIEIA